MRTKPRSARKPLTLVAAVSVVACAYQSAPATPRSVYEDDAVRVVLGAPSGVRRGQPANARIRVDPRGAYHVNLEFPTRLRAHAADGIRLARTELAGVDAARLEEEGVAFDLEFVSEERGPQTISGEVEFAVCVATECVPAAIPFTFVVDVYR